MVAQATLIPTTATHEGTKGTKRYKCPVHHGKNLSVAVGFINGRAWARCWSHGCASADILAALNLSNTPSIPWTPAPPTPTTDHQHHPVACCKPRTGARLPEGYKDT